MILTKEQILDHVTLETEIVEAFGGEVIVSQITEYEQNKLERSSIDSKGNIKMTGLKVKYIIATCVNPDGSKLFSDKDATRLSKLGARDINKVFDAASRLNKFLSEDEVQEISKN